MPRKPKLTEDQILQRQTTSFIKCAAQLQCEEFLGVARILCIPLTIPCALASLGADRIQMRELEDIFSDMIDKFILLGRPQRTELLCIVRTAGGGNNGNNTNEIKE